YFKADSGTSAIFPCSSSLCASLGISLMSSSNAWEAPITERISIQWPRSIISIKVASSQKKSWPCNPKTVKELYTRSEEHTSELQSRFDLVCRLLLEKKHTQRHAQHV